jgi:hypothetical protein
MGFVIRLRRNDRWVVVLYQSCFIYAVLCASGVCGIRVCIARSAQYNGFAPSSRWTGHYYYFILRQLDALIVINVGVCFAISFYNSSSC